MLISHHQNAGQNYKIKTVYNSFEKAVKNQQHS